MSRHIPKILLIGVAWFLDKHPRRPSHRDIPLGTFSAHILRALGIEHLLLIGL